MAGAMMSEAAGRSAVVVAGQLGSLGVLERSLERLGVAPVRYADSGAQVCAFLAELRPAVLVLDLDVFAAAEDGLTCLGRARSLLPDLRVIVISEQDDPARIDAALEAGAFAYVCQPAREEDFEFVLRQAFQHSIYIAMRARPSLAASNDAAVDGLTAREQEILRLVAEGRPNAELARLLWLSEATVKFHLARIYRKLGVTNRTQAGWWAQQHGLFDRQQRSSVVS
jgi:DNA-binding NarL/FixJ family response regulator